MSNIAYFHLFDRFFLGIFFWMFLIIFKSLISLDGERGDLLNIFSSNIIVHVVSSVSVFKLYFGDEFCINVIIVFVIIIYNISLFTNKNLKLDTSYINIRSMPCKYFRSYLLSQYNFTKKNSSYFLMIFAETF